MYEHVTIYALVDPRSDEVRYIGATGKALEVRLVEHVRAVRERYGWWGQPSFKNRWLLELQQQGLMPRIKALLRVPAAYACGFEARCIAVFAARGCRLTNAVVHRKEMAEATTVRYEQAAARRLAARAAAVPTPDDGAPVRATQGQLVDDRSPRILDLHKWDSVEEATRALDVRLTYIYQMEWRRIPFYVGITDNPWRRWPAHLGGLWHRAVLNVEPHQWCAAAPHFRWVYAAACDDLPCQMRIVDVYHRYKKPWLCEAGWIERRRAEGFYLLNRDPGNACCARHQTEGCWVGATLTSERARTQAQATLAALVMRPAPNRCVLAQEVKAQLCARVTHWGEHARSAAEDVVISRRAIFAHLSRCYSTHGALLVELDKREAGLVGALRTVDVVRQVLDQAMERYYAAQLGDPGSVADQQSPEPQSAARQAVRDRDCASLYYPNGNPAAPRSRERW